MNIRFPRLTTCLIGASVGLSLGITDALFSSAHAHGAAGGEELAPGEFNVRPVMIINMIRLLKKITILSLHFLIILMRSLKPREV